VKSEDDADKNDAYKTLHYVLVRLSYLLAPFTPFLAEELYHNLTGDNQSVHLKDWLPAGTVNELIIDEMARVREYINEGLSLRAKAGLKVRQPLARVTVPEKGKTFDFTPILLEELNVKRVLYGGSVAIDTEITPELKREGLAREIIRHVQSARKKAGLSVDDHIILGLKSNDSKLNEAIDEHARIIEGETLALKLGPILDDMHEEEVKIEGDKDLKIFLKRTV